MAGVEPAVTVLETVGLPLTDTPITRELFFRFLVCGMFFTPLAVFFELKLSLHCLFVSSRPVVDAFAYRALEFYEIGLGHGW